MQTPGIVLLAVAVGLAAGCLLGAQPSINGSLGLNVRHPFQASLISFGSGTTLLIVLSFALGIFPPSFKTAPSDLPWWIWTGGSIGVVFLTASLIFVPRVGSLPWFAAVMAGQIIASVILDHFGWLGNPKSPATPLRIFGAALLVAGVLVIVQAKRTERVQVDSAETSIEVSD